MADERNVRITPPQPEVEGHIISRKGDTPETDPQPEVAGHIAATTDAEGVPVDLETDDAGFEDPGELDVEGHARNF